MSTESASHLRVILVPDARPPSRALVLCGVAVSTLLSCALSRREIAPPPQVAADLLPEEKLGVDDVFEIKVLGEPDLSGPRRVSGDGTIDYYYSGRISVIGKRPGEIQELITAKLKDGVLKNPQVTIMVTEWNSRKINVFGQVQKPGPVAYFPGMTLLDAISAAGSFSAIAAKNSVSIRREIKGRVESRTYPVAEISEGRYPNVPVLPGDTIIVDERLF
jgi:polysaccharide export outer membrane protein